MSKKRVPKRSRKQMKPKGFMVSAVPPAMVVDDLVSSSFRYGVQAGAIETKMYVKRSDLLNLIGLSYSTSAAYRVIQAIRLRAVHIWTDPNQSTTSSNTYDVFSWLGPDTRSTATVTTSMGTSQVGYQYHVPPKKSLAAFWSAAGSNESDVLFSVTVTGGDVLQLDVTYQLQNAVTGPFTETSISTTSTLAIGYLYCFSLDHASDTTSALTPQGRLPAQ
jgi:hypothetical protein